MPDKPKEKPSYEDIEREMGLDMMSFFSDMVRPDQHEERDDDPVVPTSQAASDVLTPEHQRAIIEHLESEIGRKLTPWERHLALEKARSV